MAGFAAARPSLNPPTHPIIFRRCQPHPTADQSALVLPSAWASAAVASPAPGRSIPRPHRRPPHWCSRCGVLNVVNIQQTIAIGIGMYVERLTAGSRTAHKEMPPYYAQNNFSSTLQQGPTVWATLFREKNISPLTAGTHRTGHRISQKKTFPSLSARTHLVEA